MLHHAIILIISTIAISHGALNTKGFYVDMGSGPKISLTCHSIRERSWLDVARDACDSMEDKDLAIDAARTLGDETFEMEAEQNALDVDITAGGAGVLAAFSGAAGFIIYLLRHAARNFFATKTAASSSGVGVQQQQQQQQQLPYPQSVALVPMNQAQREFVQFPRIFDSAA